MKKESATPSPQSTDFDRTVLALLVRATQGISPVSVLQAYFDWILHLSVLPDRRSTLARSAMRTASEALSFALHAPFDPRAEPFAESARDPRFSSEDWCKWPFNVISQTFLACEQWWREATTGIPGVTCHHEEVVSFVTRQIVDMFSPSNAVFLNPEILKRTLQERGTNLARGMTNFMEDQMRAAAGIQPAGSERFKVGQNLAVTPGKVIFRNDLIELIQYSPATAQVFPEPVLIIPAWIMKYYILDLSPHNSLVRYLVAKGHTVFMISWKNPGPADRELGLDDYRMRGIMAAINAVRTVAPHRRIHSVGYCIGGTLLYIAAAAMARDGDRRLRTLTVFAGEADFTEAGELMVFIDESQVTFLENLMREQGYLDAKQMAGAFQLLRSNDLIWSRMIHDYLLGERQAMFDLMAWNADTTRMPSRMHSEYLRKLYLNNDLAQGHFTVDGKPITLRDIRAPIFAVGTQKDHVAPWHSVYKIHLLGDTEITFVLTTGGHNAGVISEPGHPRRMYRIATRRRRGRYLDPEQWMAEVPVRQGSWWPEWQKWLQRNSGALVSPPSMGSGEQGYPVLYDAPGTYVHEAS